MKLARTDSGYRSVCGRWLLTLCDDGGWSVTATPLPDETRRRDSPQDSSSCRRLAAAEIAWLDALAAASE